MNLMVIAPQKKLSTRFSPRYKH